MMKNTLLRLIAGTSLVLFSYFYPVESKSFDWGKTYNELSEEAERRKRDLEREIDNKARDFRKKAEDAREDLEKKMDEASRGAYQDLKPLAEKTFRDASEGIKYLEENPQELTRVREVYDKIENVQNGLIIHALKNVPVYDPNTGNLTTLDSAFRQMVRETDSYYSLPEELKNDPVAFTYALSTNPNIMLNSKLIPSPEGEYISLKEALNRGLYVNDVNVIINDYNNMRDSYFEGDINQFSSSTMDLARRLERIRNGQAQIYESNLLSKLSLIPGGANIVENYLLDLYNSLKKEGMDPASIDILFGTGLGLMSILTLGIGLRIISGSMKRKRGSEIREDEIDNKPDLDVGLEDELEADKILTKKYSRPRRPARHKEIKDDKYLYTIDTEISRPKFKKILEGTTSEEPESIPPKDIDLTERAENGVDGEVSYETKITTNKTSIKGLLVGLSLLGIVASGILGYHLYNSSRRPKLNYGNGSYCVQIASFKDKQNAEQLKNYLSKEGYQAYTIERFVKNDWWNGVRIGYFNTKEDAIRAKGIIISKYPKYSDAFLCKKE